MNKQEKITIYSAKTNNRWIIYFLRESLRELPQAHILGQRLFKRNLKALYRQSLLGFGWALLPPLATTGLWIFLRDGKVINVAETGIPYPVFVLTGTILWQIFNEAILAPLTQVTENKTMLTKINIPRDGLLLSGLYLLAFNTAIKFLMLALVYFAFGQAIGPGSLVFAPLGIFAIILAGFSIGLALTPLGMLYKDIERGLGILLPFFMYLTPVVYPAPQDGALSILIKLNPLATLLTQTRNWLTAQPTQDMSLFWSFTCAFGLLFLVSLAIYRLAMPIIIERIGS